MEWHNPRWLYLILPLAAAWLALSLYSRRRRQRAAAAFVAEAMWSRILPAESTTRFWVKLLLRETALVAGLVALAGPRFGTQYEQLVPRGSDLYVLIDVSRSMLAEDVPPSRLGRAKTDVAALVNRLDGDRVGLIAFAGQAVVKCPLTVDYDAFRRSLDELDPGSAPRGGTAIGDAIRKALEVFRDRADRDQAILLITDGDDQQSYPLEAAAVAAERQVTIFTVGLGDADHGARIPNKAESRSFVEYKGQQVWSKLDGTLLKEIALKTSGVYVPVGTRAYDLAELYSKYLQGRRGSPEESRQRARRGEQFQVFLALALLALLADAFTSSHAGAMKSSERASAFRGRLGGGHDAKGRRPARPLATALVLAAAFAGISGADDPASTIREGLRSYSNGQFDEARDKFAAAREKYEGGDSAKAALAAFDQACAAHRKGDESQARQWYLKAGLAHDKTLAASAHFNLGSLAAEQAGRLAGEHPESVPPEKRQEILDELKAAVASFRHCLDLEPENTHARRDIELVRQWIKYYGDRWRAGDREKRRQETNLVAFLEFLIETQKVLNEAVKALTPTSTADAFAEPKRMQEELQEEIVPLKEKIKTELAPQQPGGGSNSPSNSVDLERGIALLQDWAAAAGDKMSSAARRLDQRQVGPAAVEQQAAIGELEKIWDAVIPFHALLARDLADQTLISQSLAPASAVDAKSGSSQSSGDNDSRQKGIEPAPQASPGGPNQSSLGTESEVLGPLTETQERTIHRTQLLKLKAESELARLQKTAPIDTEGQERGKTSGKVDPRDAEGAKTKPVDPEKIKLGYERAVELSPRAIEKMDRAVKSLRQKNSQTAYPPAEEARKILEAIQKAQPHNEEQDKQQQDQNKKNEDQQKQDQKKQEQQEQRKDDRNKKEETNKEQEQKKQEKPSESNEPKQDQQKTEERPQISPDRIEEALRKVRERQQEKRERDRALKARVFGGVPVEKDW
jgi:Ca-activated chloride channel family protein